MVPLSKRTLGAAQARRLRSWAPLTTKLAAPMGLSTGLSSLPCRWRWWRITVGFWVTASFPGNAFFPEGSGGRGLRIGAPGCCHRNP